MESVESYNTLKGAILERACDAKNSELIFSAIYDLEKDLFPAWVEKLKFGTEIFSFMAKNGLEPFEESILEKLPLSLLNGRNASEIQKIFPRFKRIRANTKIHEEALQKAHDACNAGFLPCNPDVKSSTG